MGIGDTFQRVGLRLHQVVYEGTGGRIGHRALLVPTLLLTTTGRRSGRDRTVALTYARDGDGLVVVASNHGGDADPAWLHNIRSDPEVTIRIGRDRRRGRARIVEPGDADRERLWELVNANNHGRYTGYQAHTSRPIPLVVLTPRSPSA